MHAIFLFTILLVAAIAAVPPCDKHLSHNIKVTEDQDVWGSVITTIVTNYFNNLATNGYDPFEPVGPQHLEGGLPDGSFYYGGDFESIRVEGLSNVVINSMSTPLIPTYVDFDLTLPQVQVWAESATTSIKFADYNLAADGSGWISVTDVNVAGRANIQVGVPIQTNGISAVVNVGDIQANVQGNLGGLNGAIDLNGFLNNDALTFLQNNNAEVNRISGEWFKQIIASA
ncbi:uncharacterized protein LOC115448806 [Manduca sexta]|uniref:uncharacterized protein LOC115448806 n=1 Tax=Manduca sexta TaxID=7130 RepID=UPI00188F9AA8|nr:uncharacterized protein LOC115448806 [Manduca sexta]